MDDSQLVDIARHALLMALVLSSPLLLVGLAIGIVTGLFQAVTQVHDQAVSFAPKLIAMLVAFSWLLPWVMTHLRQYAGELFSAGWVSWGG